MFVSCIKKNNKILCVYLRKFYIFAAFEYRTNIKTTKITYN